MPEDRRVELSKIRLLDLAFLLVSGLDRERIGTQYKKDEYRKQIEIAPLRFFSKKSRPFSRVIRVDGRRGGYVGLNPLSLNIEYYLVPWARGGVGTSAIEMYLREILPFDVDKHAFMLEGNDRSVRVFRAALNAIGFTDGQEYEYFEYPGGSGYRVVAGSRPVLHGH